MENNTNILAISIIFDNFYVAFDIAHFNVSFHFLQYLSILSFLICLITLPFK